MKNNILIGLIFFIQISFSQTNFKDAENIKTVIFKPTNTNAYVPIIKLGEELQLIFDDLNADEHEYTYKIAHYSYDWKVSNLPESEFIDGFAEYRIREYENSFNTLQPFTNYRLTIPNSHTKVKLSGNYMLSVLNEDEEVVFIRRFIVYEPKVTIGVAIYKSRDITTINTKQTVEFRINHPNLRINNPRVEIKPVILQNNNWHNAISGLKPQYYRGTQLIYKYDKEASFWGGNEFLYFDTKSIRSSTLNIAKIELGENLYHSYLYTNQERIDQPYTYFPDINGNFTVRTLDGENTHTDADYSWVHFSLESLENLEGKELFISGNFNNWELNDSNKLNYNKSTGLYEATLLFKQGFYNYQYVTKTKEGVISTHDVDGSHYETENDYTVLVYYTEYGNWHHQVIGVGFGNSEKINN